MVMVEVHSIHTFKLGIKSAYFRNNIRIYAETINQQGF